MSSAYDFMKRHASRVPSPYGYLHTFRKAQIECDSPNPVAYEICLRWGGREAIFIPIPSNIQASIDYQRYTLFVGSAELKDDPLLFFAEIFYSGWASPLSSYKMNSYNSYIGKNPRAADSMIRILHMITLELIINEGVSALWHELYGCRFCCFDGPMMSHIQELSDISISNVIDMTNELVDHTKRQQEQSAPT